MLHNLHFLLVTKLSSFYGNQLQFTNQLLHSYFIDPAVSFELSTYNVEENSGSLELALVLSNPSSIPIAIQVLTTDGSTNGN